jgi:uncharacterized membrane-anchored protein
MRARLSDASVRVRHPGPMTSALRDRTAVPLLRPLNRVPQVTALFWVVKVLTTGMGETTSDFFVKRFPPEIVVPIAFVLLVVLLVVQFRVKRYIAAVYWTTALAVSIFGTMAADVLHVGLGVPYVASTAAFALALAAIFVAWHRTERTLSVHSIVTRRREVFYWATVLTTFALGTAAGDWTASTLHLGYLPSGVVFGVLFLLPAIAYRWFGMNAIAAFWTSYILTRPFGASFADYFGGPGGRGGLALGMDRVSIVLTAVIVAVVAYFAISKVDRPRDGEADVAAADGAAVEGAAVDGVPADRSGTTTR